jgi:flagellar biosynthetic protein FlhB
MAQQDPSRTEQATDKRVSKAREQGNVAKSQEVAKALVILGGLVIMRFYLEYVGKDMVRIFRWYLQEGLSFQPSEQNVYRLFIDCSADMAIMTLPIMFGVGLVAYAANRYQVGQLWTTKVFEFKLDRVFNPMAGLQRMFLDVKTLIRLARSLFQAIAIGIAPYLVLRAELPNMMPLFYQNASGLASYILFTSFKMIFYALIPMLIIAAVDWWYTRWDYGENLKMTKDEVKDERKQAEGDPIIKQKQRQKMLQAMARRMMKEVPKADVVITNPTHYAVALKYDPSIAPAPVVVAKGVDHLALKIKEIALENRVPIRENRPLAQALYKSVEIGDPIPTELFQAVATILAQLHKFKMKARTQKQ